MGNFISIVRKIEKALLLFFVSTGQKIAQIAKTIFRVSLPFIKKNYKTIVLALVIVYAIGGFVFGLRLYKQNRFEKADRIAANFYPFPVASTGRALIFDRNLQNKMEWSRHYADKIGQPLPEDLSKSLLQDMVYDSMIQQELSRFNLRVTQKDINTKLQEAKDEIGSEIQLENFFQENYGMSISQFKSLMTPKLALDKLMENKFAKIKASYIIVGDEKKADEALKKIQDGAKFEDIAKEYSEDQESRDDGGRIAGGEYLFKESGLPSEIEGEMFKMNKDELKKLKAPQGFAIVRIDDKAGEIQESISTWVEALSDKYKVRYWI